MVDNAIDSLFKQAYNVDHILEHYVAAALTTGTAKKEWVIPFFCRILDVIIDSETASSGGANDDIIDVNINGTTIYTTQGNRPTLTKTNTGLWARGEPEAGGAGVAGMSILRPGDILSYDVDQVDTTGSARVKVTILLGRR